MVAGPAALSLLRLWIEAGGELQTTLLIVANVNTVNLFASMFLIGTRTVTMVLVVIFALGTLLGVSAADARTAGRPLRREPLFARWAAATPLWLLVATFVLAGATWQILYLPLLLPAFVMAFQTVPAYRGFDRAERLGVYAILLIGYYWLVRPVLSEDGFIVAMFAIPPLLASLAPGPVPVPVARVLARVGQPAVLALAVWSAVPVLTVPVLPLTVTTVSHDGGPQETVRGYVITSDDQLTAVLREEGGIRYLPNDDIEGRVLCPSAEQLPIYRVRVRDLHIEDSLLEAWGRRRRPAAPTDAACRTATTPDPAAALSSSDA
ncbi:hypothetical protein Ahu01nite_011660 [Winogradskya humida]|uniref:Uncharacterized protein n=1 Tax=Winogradskya humida TaxID=113566 RepID=A0ABQ3ZHI9_9ACTN|nr:hypothetical protein Ahu01nite_011660 [Actinoplanes humidus]